MQFNCISNIHLFELPYEIQERVYCFLDERFRNEFFTRLRNYYKTIANASRKLNVSEDKIRGWMIGRNIRKVPHRIIPIQASILFSLAKELEYKLEIVEKKITAMKTKGSMSNAIFKPKLPIGLTYELGRLIGTSLGDGHLTSSSTVVYTNTSKHLVEELEKCVKSLGKVKLKTTLSSCKIYRLIIPSVIGVILNSFGVVNGNKVKQKTNVKLPQIVNNSPLEFKIGIISGLFDDEGSVIKDRKIKFKQTLPQLVEDLKNLVQSLGVNTSERLLDEDKYCFYIYRKSDMLKIKELNIFRHPEKINRLEKIIGGEKIS